MTVTGRWLAEGLLLLLDFDNSGVLSLNDRDISLCWAQNDDRVIIEFPDASTQSLTLIDGKLIGDKYSFICTEKITSLSDLSYQEACAIIDSRIAKLMQVDSHIYNHSEIVLNLGVQRLLLNANHYIESISRRGTN